jgi:DNA-binding MarR family transcriptional regulator
VTDFRESDPPLEDPRERLIWSLRRAEMAVQTAKDRRLRAIGLPSSHYALLVSIWAEPGLAGATLARRLNVTPQAIASLAARLERGGLLERRAHPRHLQVQELHLTTSGREILGEAEAIVEGLEREVVNLVGGDENGRLRAVLDRLSASLPVE